NKDYQNYDINTPIVAIPTTAGTGSEVTSWATIWDKNKCKKYSVEDERLYPRLAIIDPVLTTNLPLKPTASTALDALSHALEAYWSKRSNEIVRLYAQKSIELIIKNLNNLLDDLSNQDLRTKIAQGSLYAGLAFSNTKTTACHCISYPLTAKYNIPHGIAVSMTLAQFLNINREFIIDKRKLLGAFGVEKITEAEDVINNIFIKSQIPFKLSDYGVKKEDIGNIIKNSFIPDRMDNNPVKITKELLKRVLEDIY
ncbi:MAG TPA: phosphonoacetaldehyde reductase, partial [Clostridia bacterium]|nr:phosphonoacetaldehyde reductase [Clostridia bacterium]